MVQDGITIAFRSAAPGGAGQAKRLSLFVLVLSLAVIGGALFFQYARGLVPCELCLAERWPWYAAIPLGAIGLAWTPRRWPRGVALLFGLVFLGSAALAFYHVGVEKHFLPGPTACTAAALGGGSIEDMTRALLETPEVLCDEVQWSLFGISLAGFNLILSLIAVAAALRNWLALGSERA